MSKEMNSLYGLSTTFTKEGIKNFWKQGEAFCEYMQDLERKCYEEADDLITYPADLVQSDIKMYEMMERRKHEKDNTCL